MMDHPIKLTLPKGRQQRDVLDLLAGAGLNIRAGEHDYRPACSDARYEVKLLKAANIPKLVEYGAHDIGITGRDWIEETGADVVELLDTGLLPVRLVAAAPRNTDPFALAERRPVIVASEYEMLTRRYLDARGVPYHYVRTYGATEVFPPRRRGPDRGQHRVGQHPAGQRARGARRTAHLQQPVDRESGNAGRPGAAGPHR
jgi:ATP phosphoribosyltransferase